MPAFPAPSPGYYSPEVCKSLSCRYEEKNEDLGGTWYESSCIWIGTPLYVLANYNPRCPAVACEVKFYWYQFTFESNSTWSRYWVGGAKILAYLKEVATKYNAKKVYKVQS